MSQMKKATARLLSFRVIYLIAIIFNYHTLLVAFTNSTYMETFASAKVVSMMFSVSALISVLFFATYSRIIGRCGNFPTLCVMMLLEIASLFIIATTTSASWALLAFFFFLALNPLIYLAIDVFAESIVGDNEAATGTQRGLLLTLTNFAAMIAPFTVAYIVSNTEAGLSLVYIVAACFGALFLLVTTIFFYDFKDPIYEHQPLMLVLKRIIRSHTLFPVFSAHFLLQIFFAWTTIYIPLYMITVLGFSWNDVGIIIGIGLFAYVLLQYPAGIIADRYIGEKEMMILGFLIIISTCIFIPFFTAGVVGWAILMFYSRIGAALIEATTESYFFKHTSGRNAAYISLFRMLRPLSLSAGSLLGTACLYFIPFQYSFLVLGTVLVLGLLISTKLVDTR